MDGKQLGERIKTHRTAAGMTLQRVAELVGTTKSHVWEMENGRVPNPSLWMVKGIANAFGYTVSGFIGETATTVNNGGRIRELADEIRKLTH